MVEVIGLNIVNSERFYTRSHNPHVCGVPYLLWFYHKYLFKYIYILFNNDFKTITIYFLQQWPIIIIPLNNNTDFMDTIWQEQGNIEYFKKIFVVGSVFCYIWINWWVRESQSEWTFKIRSNHNFHTWIVFIVNLFSNFFNMN